MFISNNIKLYRKWFATYIWEYVYDHERFQLRHIGRKQVYSDRNSCDDDYMYCKIT